MKKKQKPPSTNPAPVFGKDGTYGKPGAWGVVEWAAGCEIGKTSELKKTFGWRVIIQRLKKTLIVDGLGFPFIVRAIEEVWEGGRMKNSVDKFKDLASTIKNAEEIQKKFAQHYQPKKKPKKGKNQKTPENCRPVTDTDTQNVHRARHIIKKKDYPSFFAVMTAHTGKLDKVFQESCRRAWLLDYARLTGNVLDPALSSDPDFYALLYSAIRNHRRRKESTKRRHSIDEEIARGWICEKYCNLSSRKLAERMSKKFGGTVTKNQISALKVRHLNKLLLYSNVEDGAPTKMV